VCETLSGRGDVTRQAEIVARNELTNASIDERDSIGEDGEMSVKC